MVRIDVQAVDQMVVAMARATRGPALVAGVTPLTQLAAALASRLDPSLWLLGSEGALLRPDVLPPPLRLTDAQPAAYRAAHHFGRLSLHDVFGYVSQGRFRIWISPAQVDSAGAANITAIGPWREPAVALVGARGLPDDSVELPMLYVVTHHDPRSLVARVDFRSAAGHPSGARFGRPHLLVTDLGVFRHEGEHGFVALSLHAGVSARDVQDRTGFPIRFEESVDVTPFPSAMEWDLIQTLDPCGLRYLERHGAGADERQAAIERERSAPFRLREDFS